MGFDGLRRFVGNLTFPHDPSDSMTSAMAKSAFTVTTLPFTSVVGAARAGEARRRKSAAERRRFILLRIMANRPGAGHPVIPLGRGMEGSRADSWQFLGTG